jgi:hypothetical protein
MKETTPHTHDDDTPAEPVKTSFWRSRAGAYLIVALVIGGLLLGYEHRVHIFASDWTLSLLLLICVGMHFFMHGGHGGHGSGGDKS